MATVKSEYRNGTKPMPVPGGAEVVSVRTTLSLAAAQVANGNIYEMFDLPANCVPVGWTFTNSDLDSGANTFTADLGIITTAANTHGTTVSTAAANGGDEWLDGTTALANAAAVTKHDGAVATLAAINAVTPVNYDRVVAFVVMSAPTTGANGTITMEMSYRAA